MIPIEQYFKCFSDETRLRCIMLLYKKGQLCVCELTQVLEISQPKMSRHLTLLRHHHILQDVRKGQWVYYQIHPNLPVWANVALQAVEQATANHLLYQQDLVRLDGLQKPNQC